jgi:hypothetical protein
MLVFLVRPQKAGSGKVESGNRILFPPHYFNLFFTFIKDLKLIFANMTRPKILAVLSNAPSGWYLVYIMKVLLDFTTKIKTTARVCTPLRGPLTALRHHCSIPKRWSNNFRSHLN